MWQQNQNLRSDIENKKNTVSNLEQQLAAEKNGLETGSTNDIIIRELGISVTVPDSIKDITYSYRGEGIVSFSTKTLTDEYIETGECTSFGSAPPLGSLVKIEGQYPEDPNVDNTPADKLVKQFATYYIGYRSPRSLCVASQVEAPSEELTTFQEALTTTEVWK